MNKTLRTGAELLALLLPPVTLIGPFLRVPGLNELNLTVAVLSAELILGVILALRERLNPFGNSGAYMLPFCIMLVYCGVSLIWAVDPAYSVYAFGYEAQGVLLTAILAAFAGTEKKLYRLLDVLTACWVLLLPLGAFEILTGRYLFSPDNPEISLVNAYHRHFPYTVFHNTNDLSAFLTLFLPFAVCRLTGRFRGLPGKILAAAAAVFYLFILFNSDARLCYIGLALMILAFAAAAARKGLLKKPRSPLKTAGWVLAVLLPLTVTGLLKFRVILREFRNISLRDHSVSERLSLAGAALRMFLSSRMLGVGVGNATALVPRYSAISHPENLHNVTLQILAECGIIIFAALAAFFLVLAVKLFRKGPRRGEILECAGFAALCGYPVIGAASSDITHILPVWLLFGILLGLIRCMEDRAGRPAGYGG